MTLPMILPGFRFLPTDEELIGFYLKRKVAGRNIEFDVIAEVDLYKQEPWDLPQKSLSGCNDLEWYFYNPLDKKCGNGLRTNRATEAGHWKATGKDRHVKKAGQLIGMKKTLVFHQGRAPRGERTNWVMHEYRLDGDEGEKVCASQHSFVLCRVFKKSSAGPRSGEDRGPQTYVDDDILGDVPVDQSMPGSLADKMKKAIEQGGQASTPFTEVPALEHCFETEKDLEPEPVSMAPLSTKEDTCLYEDQNEWSPYSDSEKDSIMWTVLLRMIGFLLWWR